MAGRGGSTNEGFVDSDSNVINHSRFDAKDIDDDPRDSSNDVEDPETRWRPNSTTSSSRKYVPKPNNNNISDEMDMQEISIKPDDDEGVSLQRSLGLWSGISIVAGTMIGSGIFVSPTGVISKVGSVGLSLIVWTGCGFLALLGSLCYAELGTAIPESGGEYAYFLRIYKGKENRHVGNIIAFLFTWVNVALLKPSSIAIISLVFAEYLSVPMFDACGPPPLVKKLLATCLLVVLTGINCFSVGAAVKVQNIFTAAKIIALLMIIIGGIIQLSGGQTQFLTPPLSFASSKASPSSIALAFYSGLWAYDGWNQLNFITEEMINPKRNLPLALGIGIPLVMVLYVLVNVAYFTVLSPAEIKASTSAAVAFGERALGPLAGTIPYFVAASCVGAVNGSLFTAGRSVFVAAREGHLPHLLSMVSSRFLTPLPALLLQSFIAVIMAFTGEIMGLIDFFSFAVWLFYALTFLANVLMRFQTTFKTDPRFLNRPVKLPLFIPLICFLISVFLVIAPIIDDPSIEIFYAFLFILAGLLLYLPFVHFKFKLRCFDDIAMFFQLLFLVSPPKTELE